MPTHQRETLRDQFSPALDELGVDCYAVFCQDAWRQFAYTPHEIDPRAYYPEVLQATPIFNRFDQVVEALNRDNAKAAERASTRLGTDLREHWEPDATILPRFLNPRSVPLDVSLKRLFGSFVERENIRSCVAFSPLIPVTYPNFSLPELLFLNFRTRQSFLEPQKSRLRSLAAEMLGRLKSEHLLRIRQWNDVLARTVSVQSELVLHMAQMLTPGGILPSKQIKRHQTNDEFYKVLVEAIVKALGLDGKNQNGDEWLVSLMLLKENAESLKLKTQGHRPPLEDTNDDRTLNGLFRPKEFKGITTTSILTRQTIFMNYVDDIGEVSVELTDKEAAFAQLCDLPSECRILEYARRDGQSVFRLSISREKLSVLDGCKFAVKRPHIFESLRERSRQDYASLYVPLKNDWRRPLAEITVPIILFGQAIGCINVERRTPYCWNPAVINVLTFVAGMFGISIANWHKSQMISATAELLSALRVSGGSKQALRSRLAEFAVAVQGALFCKKVEFSVRSSNPVRKEELYSRLVSSDVSRQEFGRPVRSGGWTTLIGENRSIIGAVILLPDLDKLEQGTAMPHELQICRGWWLKSDSSTSFRCEEISLGQLRNLPNLLLSKEEHQDCRWLIGLKLPVPWAKSSREAVVGQASDAVMWIHHRSYGTCDFGVESNIDNDRLASYCAHAISIAGACEVIPAVWQATLHSSQQVNAHLRHGGLIDPIASLGITLRKAQKALSKDRPAEAEDARSAADLADYIQMKVDVCGSIGMLFTPSDMAEGVSHAARVSDPISVSGLVDKAWRIAQKLTYFSPGQERDVIFQNRIPNEIRLTTHSALLLEILVQTLRNARVHAKQPGKECTIVALCSVLSEGDVEIVIEDNGPGLEVKAGAHRPAIAGYVEMMRDSGHGIGTFTMDACSRALRGKVDFEKASLFDSGCRVVIYIPDAGLKL